MPPLEGIPKKSRDIVDPRINELREMGLPDLWIEIAEAIGHEAFMTIWMILDRDNILTRGERETLRVWIPQTHCYYRYQRNQYIKTLAAADLSLPEIQKRVKHDLGEDLHLRTIMRAISPAALNKKPE